MKILRIMLGLLIFSFSLTILYLSMRAVLGVGGSCAEGGPYVIAQHCPGGTAWLTPLSVFLMMVGGALYLAFPVEKAPNWSMFFWTALFVSLGWNFLDFAIWQGGGQIDYMGVMLALMFGIMGVAPLVFMDKKTLLTQLVGENFLNSAWIVLVHLCAAGIGIWAGWQVFAYF